MSAASMAADSASGAWLPDVLSVARTSDGWRFVLQIAAGAPVFSGHFPDLPVLPGVAQLHWASVLYRQHSGDLRPVRALRRVKFQRMVAPGECVELSCSLRRADELQFAYCHVDGERMSAGQLLLGPVLVGTLLPEQTDARR